MTIQIPSVIWSFLLLVISLNYSAIPHLSIEYLVFQLITLFHPLTPSVPVVTVQIPLPTETSFELILVAILEHDLCTNTNDALGNQFKETEDSTEDLA